MIKKEKNKLKEQQKAKQMEIQAANIMARQRLQRNGIVLTV